MSCRYLIVNADDFGICRETNDAIEHLFNEGRITSTTVMIPCPESRDAVNRAVNNKKINMGLHITLNSDFSNKKWRSTASSDMVSSLLDEDGSFFTDINCFYSNAVQDEVGAEINTQYDTAVSLGYTPDHADSHCGTLYGITGRPFLKEAYELCAKHKLPFRFPKSENYIANMFHGNIPPEIIETHAKAVEFAGMMGIPILTDMVTNPFNIKDIPDYKHLKAFYLNAIGNIKEGITELFLHPSYDNREFSAVTPMWQKRIWEYQFLMDDDYMKAIESEGITLVSWRDATFDV